jgi:hypothetical protein
MSSQTKLMVQMALENYVPSPLLIEKFWMKRILMQLKTV